MYWFLLAAIALLAIAGLMLHSSLRALELRAIAIDDAARRSHSRLDNHQRQLDALGRELGWADDRCRTKMLTGKLPLMDPPKEP